MDSQEPGCVGIDLGTTRSAVAWATPQLSPHLLPLEGAQLLSPSALFFPPNQQPLRYGASAYQAILLEPQRGAMFFKRRMQEPQWHLLLNERTYDAPTLTRLYLQYLYEKVSLQTGPIEHTAIGVPAYFDDQARRYTLKAAKLAGWPQPTLINEPTAVMLAQGLLPDDDEPSHQLVFDLGAGTLDVTVARVEAQALRVLACVGDTELGGQDWDDCLAWDAARRFERQFKWSPFDDPVAFEYLRRSCERCKELLSFEQSRRFSFQYDGCQLSFVWEREELEQLCAGLVARCIEVLQEALTEAGLSPDKLDRCLLAGGGSRMPMLRKALAQLLPCGVDERLDPGSVMAIGAATYAFQQRQPDAQRAGWLHQGPFLPGQVVTDVSSHPLGFLVLRGGQLINKVVLPKNTALPASVKRTGLTTSRDDQRSLDIYLTQTELSQPPPDAIFDVWEVTDIPPRPSGETELTLHFHLQKDGIPEVECIDQISGEPLPTHHKMLSDVITALLPPPRDVIFAIDCSASMKGRSILEAKLSVSQCLSQLDSSSTRAALISFGDPGVQIRVGLHQDPILFKTHLAALRAFGTTPMGAAIQAAIDAFAAPRLDAPEREKLLVILTDGLPDQPEAAAQIASNAHAQGIRIIAISIGEASDRAYLAQSICQSDTDVRDVKDALGLPKVMAELATELTETEGALLKWRDEKQNNSP